MSTNDISGSQLVMDSSAKCISDIISETECLRRVPVSRRTWFSWRADGKIPTIKVNRRCLYHWPSVEAALLRMQRGGVIIFVFLFLALAESAMGQTPILEVSLQAPAALVASGNLPSGNTLFGQIVNLAVNVAGSSSVRVWADGLADAVPAMTMTTLDCASSVIIASSPVPNGLGSHTVRDPLIPEPTRNLCRVHPGQAIRQTEHSIEQMKTQVAAKPAPSAAPAVSVVKKSVFAFKTRPVIAPKGLQTANYGGSVNEQGTKNGEEFNRVIKAVELEAVDSKGRHFVLTKDYNIMPGGRGANTFVQDYNSWTGAGLTEDDLFESFDGDANKGQTLVVDVGHRKVGKEWEAYIMAFHPEGYTGEAVEA